MNTSLKGVRPLDYVLTAVLVALAVVLGVANATAGDDPGTAHAMDSRSWLILPVLVLAAVPILWRRRAVLPALAVSILVFAASLPMFGWITRCGLGLPLAIAYAYAVARFAGAASRQVIGVVGVVVLELVVLVEDASTGGLGALGIGLPLAALAYGAGLVVNALADRRAAGSTLAPERVSA